MRSRQYPKIIKPYICEMKINYTGKRYIAPLLQSTCKEVSRYKFEIYVNFLNLKMKLI